MNTIKIGKDLIGEKHKTYIIAEIGSNHNNDLGLALESIQAAADAGVDAVKFQTFRADDHYSKYTPGFKYLDKTNTHALIKSLELDRTWHEKLKECAEKNGLIFFSSPCDFDAIKSLTKIDTPLYKVASFDITDNRLVSEIAKTKKPIIILLIS